jgi:hypothetical protein
MNKKQKSKIKKEFLTQREILNNHILINFNMINDLKGNKEVLSRAFNHTKSELLNG